MGAGCFFDVLICPCVHVLNLDVGCLEGRGAFYIRASGSQMEGKGVRRQGRGWGVRMGVFVSFIHVAYGCFLNVIPFLGSFGSLGLVGYVLVQWTCPLREVCGLVVGEA